jgi:ferredoxin-like protein FixX
MTKGQKHKTHIKQKETHKNKRQKHKHYLYNISRTNCNKLQNQYEISLRLAACLTYMTRALQTRLAAGAHMAEG